MKTWPVIISQWITALSFSWTSCVLFLANSLAMHHYENVLGGKPLPAITEWTAASSVWFYLYPLPTLLIALYGSFRPAKKNVLIFAQLAAISFAIAMMTILLGTVLPAIPYWPMPLQHE